METFWQQEPIDGGFCSRCDDLRVSRQYRMWWQYGEASAGCFEQTNHVVCWYCYIILTWPNHDCEDPDYDWEDFSSHTP